MSELFAFGLGLPTRNQQQTILDTYFPRPAIHLSTQAGTAIRSQVKSEEQVLEPAQLTALADALANAGESYLAEGARQLAATDRPALAVVLERDEALSSTAAAYLKLHLLSHRLAIPNSLNLDNIFPQLPNLVWTNRGPIDPREIEAALIDARLKDRPLTINGVDKFPRMTDYVIPSGVRIADASRIRLGAYLGEGTTVMHEGFVNFNAGAMGPNMIEGRISQGVIVDAHSDLGGSSSTMGTLSGGGNIRISVGKHCLIGANAGTGIALGDRCTIEAGLYITSGTRVQLLDENGDAVKTVKARELSGNSDMLFIRNSATGAVQCRTNKSAIALNEALHAHN